MRLVQGRLSDAQRTFESALELAKANGGLRGTADMHVGLSEVLLDRNDLDGAQGTPRRRRTARRTGRPPAAPVSLAGGDGPPPSGRRRPCRRDRAVRRGRAALQHRHVAAGSAGRPPLKVRAQIANGDLARARRWATSSGLSPDDELAYVREYEHVTLARVLVADGAIGDAAPPPRCAWATPRADRGDGSEPSSRS